MVSPHLTLEVLATLQAHRTQITRLITLPVSDIWLPYITRRSSRPIRVSVPPSSVEDPIDRQNAVIEGTNPGQGPTTGGIEIWIYGTNLPNGSTPLYARLGENVTRVVSANELLGVCGLDVIPSRTSFNPAFCPVTCPRGYPLAGISPPLGESLYEFEFYEHLNET